MNEHGPGGRREEALPVKLLATVWLPFACGYFLSYVFRTINAIIAPELVRELGVNPAQLGLLTSAYFFSFALFQLPLGLLLDRFGPRRVECVLLLCAAAGAVVFGWSRGLGGLVFGRALIGLGVSACLMGSIKAFVQWFPLARLATLNGWLLAAGGVGAIAASAPAEAALQWIDWRTLFFLIAGCTAAAAALMFALVPDKGDAAVQVPLRELLAGLRVVVGHPAFWRVTLVFALVQGTFLSVQGLWAAPWLSHVGAHSRPEVGRILMWIALAMTVGYATMGNLTDQLARRGIDPMTVLKSGTAISIAVFAAIASGALPGSILVWLLYGFFGTSTVLVYPIISRMFPPALTGRANTAANMILFVCAFALQWGLGTVINLWPAQDGRYPAAAYQAAFAVPLALQCCAFAWMLMKKR
jgi:MFS family permease